MPRQTTWRVALNELDDPPDNTMRVALFCWTTCSVVTQSSQTQTFTHKTFHSQADLFFSGTMMFSSSSSGWYFHQVPAQGMKLLLGYLRLQLGI